LSNAFALKAKENLTVGLELLDSGRINAAANRLYYALHQAAVHAFEQLGNQPDQLQNGAKGWKHDVVKNNLGLLGTSQQDRVIYVALKGLREEADYKPTTVAKSQLTGRRQKVVDLVNELTK
jgi:hypothetical protein